MIYNKDYRNILKTLDKKNTLIITDPPYNVGWNYDTYNDNLSDKEYGELFAYFQGYKFVVIHYIEDIIKYIVPYMGIPTKVIQWVYNSNMRRQHRSIAFFNCKPDLTKVKQNPKDLKDKRNYKDRIISPENLKKTRIYDWWHIDIVKNNTEVKNNYSNQIPEKVIGNIIKTTATNEIIFDAFMGTGTTLAVASKLGFKYVGCDISQKAYQITKRRLSEIENNLFSKIIK
ncbi:MAG: putative modification methylase [Prokaryotic dsDNA virus sp.]|nr:MAG: putative modification methylase [Prokaryotic dsDNA virus sp.]|tara:strand:+ start:16960 stop:17646 length:687 start_codon:yes stop_codon:yes gene_type:complete